MRDPFAPYPHSGERFQILALDGGGLKGIFSAAILAGFERDLGYSVVEHFDLITGTSTGGLIALGLGAGMSPNELVELYAELGPIVFPPRKGILRARQLVRPKYEAEKLRAQLNRVFGVRMLADSTKRLVIPAYNLGERKVHLFKTPHHPRLKRDWRVPMVDVALATAAAPTFFAAHRLEHMRLIDGGVWANNPATLGIAEAVSMFGVPLEAIRVFSLGTTSGLKHHAERTDRGGILRWARRVPDILMDGQGAGATNLACHLVGTENVLRIDPVVPADMFRLDRVDAGAMLGKAATHSRVEMPNFERIFDGYRAQRYEPLHLERTGPSDVRTT